MNLKHNTLKKNRQLREIVFELVIMLAFGIGVFIVAGHYDLLEFLIDFSHLHENWELDELLPLAVYLVFALSLFSLRRWQEIRRSAELLRKNNEKLRGALREIKHLQGILPICANCKKIRDDKGYWHQVESYIREHSLAEFSHSICPTCAKQLYPEVADNL